MHAIIRTLFAVAIAAFWGVMMFLLVRVEMRPDSDSILSIPVDHVWRVVFRHAQASELSILEKGQPIGGLTLQPKTDEVTRERSLNFGGNMWMQMPLVTRQRLIWDGNLVFDSAMAISNLRLSFFLREQDTRTIIEWSPVRKEFSYSLLQGKVVVDQGKVGATQAGFEALLGKLGIDPTMVRTSASSMSPPVVEAVQGSLTVRGEKVDAYVINIKQGSTAMLQCYISQIGQLLLVRTPFGYSLAAEDIGP